jgi:hypothetical protein
MQNKSLINCHTRELVQLIERRGAQQGGTEHKSLIKPHWPVLGNHALARINSAHLFLGLNTRMLHAPEKCFTYYIAVSTVNFISLFG